LRAGPAQHAPSTHPLIDALLDVGRGAVHDTGDHEPFRSEQRVAATVAVVEQADLFFDDRSVHLAPIDAELVGRVEERLHRDALVVADDVAVEVHGPTQDPFGCLSVEATRIDR
jgi:hypothetical protein